MATTHFVQQFLRNPRQVGAIAPSGRQLCQLLARTAGVADARVVVEFGSGTGTVTQAILREKEQAARLIGIEINARLAAGTRRRYPQAEIVHGDASRATEILAQRGLNGCDCVVSGLPWASFPELLQDKLLDAAYRALRPGGRFVTFAYLQGLLLPAARAFQAKLRACFPVVSRTPVVWANFPPALAYLAEK